MLGTLRLRPGTLRLTGPQFGIEQAHYPEWNQSRLRRGFQHHVYPLSPAPLFPRLAFPWEEDWFEAELAPPLVPGALLAKFEEGHQPV